MAVAALMAIPALADGLRGRALAMRRYRQDASKSAAAAWLRAVRSLLPILASRRTAEAVAQRRARPPRPPARPCRAASDRRSDPHPPPSAGPLGPSRCALRGQLTHI
jgi:hypothetical protein